MLRGRGGEGKRRMGNLTTKPILSKNQSKNTNVSPLLCLDQRSFICASHLDAAGGENSCHMMQYLRCRLHFRNEDINGSISTLVLLIGTTLDLKEAVWVFSFLVMRYTSVLFFSISLTCCRFLFGDRPSFLGNRQYSKCSSQCQKASDPNIY